MIEIRPEAVEAATGAVYRIFEGGASDEDIGVVDLVDAAIAVFCEAEELTVEYRPEITIDEIQAAQFGGLKDKLVEQRLVGKWRDVER